MMSHKTLNGIETKWSKAFPPKEAIAGIFEAGAGETMNCLHYADYDAVDITDNLANAIGYGGAAMNALQLDMVWPDPIAVESALPLDRRPEVILQVGAVALEAVHSDPKKVVERLYEYEGVVDYILLDKSMGRGLGMDAVGLLPFAHAIANEFFKFDSFGLVAAGGLGPTTLNLVEPLVEVFPNISIDAQGKLRPSGSALDPIDWDMAEEYLKQALALLP
jgi:hypothetical protein